MSFNNGSVRNTPPRPVQNISRNNISHAPTGRKGSSAPKSTQEKPSMTQARALGKVLSGNKTNIGDQKAAQSIHAKNYENFFHAAVQALKNGGLYQIS